MRGGWPSSSTWPYDNTAAADGLANWAMDAKARSAIQKHQLPELHQLSPWISPGCLTVGH
jgi:hypothetical protein